MGSTAFNRPTTITYTHYHIRRRLPAPGAAGRAAAVLFVPLPPRPPPPTGGGLGWFVVCLCTCMHACLPAESGFMRRVTYRVGPAAMMGVGRKIPQTHALTPFHRCATPPPLPRSSGCPGRSRSTSAPPASATAAPSSRWVGDGVRYVFGRWVGRSAHQGMHPPPSGVGIDRPPHHHHHPA